MNINTAQAHFIVLHGKNNPNISHERLVDILKGIFLIEKLDISRYGNARGKIVKFSDKNFLKYLQENPSNSIELYAGTNAYNYEDVPANNWGLMTAYFPQEHTLVVAKAIDSKITKDGWCQKIISRPELLALFDYGYAYSTSIPYGLGFAIGLYAEDEYHDILDFDNMERVNNWRRAVSSGSDVRFLRDLFSLNIFSKGKMTATNIQNIIQANHFSPSIEGYFLLEIEDEEMPSLREKLKSENVLVSEHLSDTFSQIYSG